MSSNLLYLNAVARYEIDHCTGSTAELYNDTQSASLKKRFSECNRRVCFLQRVCSPQRTMWVLACVGCLYVYIVIVVLPTVRSGLVKAPKLAADCTLQQRIAAWCGVVAIALFNSAQLSADKHKNAPGKAPL
jgi:hypothetical protein